MVAMSPTLKISFVDVLISVVEVVEGFGWLGRLLIVLSTAECWRLRGSESERQNAEFGSFSLFFIVLIRDCGGRVTCRFGKASVAAGESTSSGTCFCVAGIDPE
jgi:hypothetical protein